MQSIKGGGLTSSHTVGLDVDGDSVARGYSEHATSVRVSSVVDHWSKSGKEPDVRDSGQGDCITAGNSYQSAKSDEYKACLERASLNCPEGGEGESIHGQREETSPSDVSNTNSDLIKNGRGSRTRLL